MGNFRIHTVSRILRAPPEEHDAMVETYVNQKGEKILSKYRALDSFERYARIQDDINEQIDVATLFLSEKYETVINNQSADAVAQSSHDHLDILNRANRLRNRDDIFTRIDDFRVLTDYLTRPHLEPLNKRAVIETLKTLALEIPHSQWRIAFRLPLALAICSRFAGVPSQRRHRQEVNHFLDTYFASDLADIGAALGHELWIYNWQQASDLLSEYRMARPSHSTPLTL